MTARPIAGQQSPDDRTFEAIDALDQAIDSGRYDYDEEVAGGN